ncbi:hypothetical protein JP0569_12350 [Helicobacter pylori]
MKNQQKEKDQTPYKIALFKNLNLAPSFPLTKRLKRVFHQTLPKKKRVQKKKDFKKRVQKRKALKKRVQKKESFEKSVKNQQKKD